MVEAPDELADAIVAFREERLDELRHDARDVSSGPRGRRPRRP